MSKPSPPPSRTGKSSLKEKRSSRALQAVRSIIRKKPKTENINTDVATSPAGPDPDSNTDTPMSGTTDGETPLLPTDGETPLLPTDGETPLLPNHSNCHCHPHHLTNLRDAFPLQIPESLFVQETFDKLVPLGFHKSNTIPCVSLCRDELTKPLLNAIDEVWQAGPDDIAVFAMHSLGGMVFLGKTGLTAATHHAPQVEGVSRYVFYVFTHIGINANGNVGKVKRHGIDKESTACGALIAFQEELESGYINLELDNDDIEQSILKQRLLRKIKFGNTPTIVELTKVAYQVCVEDLKRLIEAVIHGDRADYAVFTGVQINSGGRLNFIWPGESYAIVDGKKIDLADWDEHPIEKAPAVPPKE